MAEPTPGNPATIRLDGVTTFAELRDRLAALRDPGTCRAVVVTGADWAPPDAPPPGMRLDWLELYELPLVFGFDGELRGAAFEVALACDLRVCSTDAAMRVSSIGTPRLLRLIGQRGSVTVMEQRGRLTASEALALGLVSAVGKPGESGLDVAYRLADTIASRGPIATRLAKEALWRGLEMPLEQALRFETDLTLLLQTTKDRAEGVRAFMEKRTPHFTGE
jgi:enoyl-CoA hydratase/carnithine racemase